MDVFDVVLHTNVGMFRDGAQRLLQLFPPVKERIDMGEGFWIGHLDAEMARALMGTCEPKVLGISVPIRQYAHFYAFCRDLDARADIARWDDEHHLSKLVSLSRLIHPTSVGFRYAARVRRGNKGLSIVPAQAFGISPDVFLSPSHTRDWLTAQEARSVGSFYSAAGTLTDPSFPKRVSRALWYFDYAQRTYYADLRWTMIVTALEALIHTGRGNNTKQFKNRVPALAVEVGGPPMAIHEANAAYDFRSRLSHGDAFLNAMPQADINLYDKLEETLRMAVLRAFTDSTFAAIFSNESSVDAKWPV